jgi:hypothetical protein
MRLQQILANGIVNATKVRRAARLLPQYPEVSMRQRRRFVMRGERRPLVPPPTALPTPSAHTCSFVRPVKSSFVRACRIHRRPASRLHRRAAGGARAR